VTLLLLDRLLFEFDVFVEVLFELSPAVDKLVFDKLFEEFCVKFVSLEFYFLKENLKIHLNSFILNVFLTNFKFESLPLPFDKPSKLELSNKIFK
jgi:hypothetical protein